MIKKSEFTLSSYKKLPVVVIFTSESVPQITVLRMGELWSVNLGNADLSESGCGPEPSKLQNLLHMAQVNSVKSKLSRTLTGTAEQERALGSYWAAITVDCNCLLGMPEVIR